MNRLEPYVETFRYDGLGNSAYLVVDPAEHVAAVVDPQRDVDQYVKAASRHGARITHVLETHLHADFLSGGRQLATDHGAAIVASSGAGLSYPHLPVAEGAVVRVGSLEFGVLATPGHTPEHVAYRVDDLLFSGGALMVGTVARVDLLGHEHAPGLARQAHHTLHDKLFRLPDGTRVLPTHGAGSFCAQGAQAAAETTIGDEKRNNRFASLHDPAAFVREALANLPRYPRYFDRMRGMNQAGPELLVGLPILPALEPAEVARRVRHGALLVDARPPLAFDAEHIPGSLAVPLDPQFSQWLGWLLDPSESLLFVLDAPRNGEQVVRELVRIGYDALDGHLAGGVPAWKQAGSPTCAVHVLEAAGAARCRASDPDLLVIDVRWDDEWAAGHVPGALHIPLPDLSARMDEVPPGRPLLVHCAHAFRSVIAVSLLEQAGRGPIYHLTSGFESWEHAGQPIERAA